MKHRCNYLFKEVFNLRYKNYKKKKKQDGQETSSADRPKLRGLHAQPIRKLGTNKTFDN